AIKQHPPHAGYPGDVATRLDIREKAGAQRGHRIYRRSGLDVDDSQSRAERGDLDAAVQLAHGGSQQKRGAQLGGGQIVSHAANRHATIPPALRRCKAETAESRQPVQWRSGGQFRYEGERMLTTISEADIQRSSVGTVSVGQVGIGPITIGQLILTDFELN